jgi:hypothetical protein
MNQQAEYNNLELINSCPAPDLRIRKVRDSLKKMLEDELAKAEPTLGHGLAPLEKSVGNIHNSILPWGWS